MATLAQPRGHASGLYRPAGFLLFVAGGFAIFLFGNNWTSPFPTNDSDLYKLSLPIAFAVLALALRGPRLAEMRGIAVALFVAAAANAMLALAGPPLGRALLPAATPAQTLALDKIAQAIPVVLTLLVLTLRIDRKLSAVFLRRGDLRWGLRTGGIGFGICAVLFAGIAVLQSGGPQAGGLFASGVPLATITAALPWVLIFIFTNSFMEELWFRGIFLDKLRPALGQGLTLVATALVFASTHFLAVYVTVAQRILFVAVVFGLGLLNGYVMQRSRSIWGSVLIHAGYDLFVIIPLLAR